MNKFIKLPVNAERTEFFYINVDQIIYFAKGEFKNGTPSCYIFFNSSNIRERHVLHIYVSCDELLSLLESSGVSVR